jgi:hypothetical protein
MKLKLLLLAVAVVALSLFIQSCGGDEDPVKNVLITSHRGTGQFYSIDVTTGVTTPIFSISQTGTTLKDFRAFVYHPKQNKYFVSEATNSGGDLFSVDVESKSATLINDNDGEIEWDAVVNWVVDTDDSLLSVGDFNGNDNAFVKFGVNGGRSGRDIEVAGICCGFGMLYDSKAGIITLGNSNNADDGEVIIDRFTKAGVKQGSSILITTFNNFPEGSAMATSWLTTKCLAQDGNGPIYGIVFNDDTDDSYLVEIDLTALTVTYISTLGIDNSNQYNVLAFVPENKL